MAEGAPVCAVLEDFERAIDFARMNQLLYQVNYNDDYDWTDGLCHRVTGRLQQLKDRFWADCSKTLRLAERRAQPVPETVRQKAEPPVLWIPWEAVPDILPGTSMAVGPPLCLHTKIGAPIPADYYCLGVVFTVEVLDESSGWRPLFRRGIHRGTGRWEDWFIPLPTALTQNNLQLRFVTDSYSRAQDRNAPSWEWARWRTPRVLAISSSGSRRIAYDFGKEIDSARALVRLDTDGKDRSFDGIGKDSTGATFTATHRQDSGDWEIAAFTPHLNGQFGVTIGEYTVDRNRFS
jgi:hypothetical protein